MTFDAAASKVSVVISCYNYALYLAGAVDSALVQSHKTVEVIIVDDGSTDDTPLVASKYARDPRVVYVRQSNAGQAAAKNTGIRRSTGDFVAFLDADDRWRSDKLEKQLPLFSNPAVGVVFSRMRPIDAHGAPIEARDAAEARRPKRGRVTDPLFIDNFIPFSSSVVRRSVFDQIGLMDTSISMGIDWDLWLRASVAHEFDYVDEELLDYRVGHAGQMSHRQEERHGWADGIMKKFLESHPGAVDASTVRYAWLHTYNTRAYWYRSRNLGRSTGFYVKSLSVQPFQLAAYRGLVANAVAGVRSLFGSTSVKVTRGDV